LLAGEAVALTSTDGCGAPLFLLTMAGLARSIRAITISTDPIHQSVVKIYQKKPKIVIFLLQQIILSFLLNIMIELKYIKLIKTTYTIQEVALVFT
jgi:hypothetical protein